MNRLLIALVISMFMLSANAGDVSISNLSIDSRENIGNHWVEGTIVNQGSSTINSLTINWTVDNGVSRTDELTGLNIVPGSSYDWTHSLGWGADNTGNYTFKVWVSEVNGIAASEQLQKLVEVFEAKKVGLVEVITSANCNPCAAQVPPLQQRVDNANSFAISVEYHAGPGPYSGDPMYNDNKPLYNARMGYYNGNAYPTSILNGKFGTYSRPAQISSQALYNETQNASDLTIENLTLTLDSGFANFSADVSSINSPSSYILSYKVQVVLIEKQVKFSSSPGTNGQTEFVNVAKQFYPSHFQGTFLRDVLRDGYISGGFDLSSLNIYDPTQLGVIIFIQNNSLSQPTGVFEIFQAAFTDLKGEPDVTVPQVPTSIDVKGSVGKLEAYPNPARDKIFVELPTVTTNANGKITITDVTGRTVKVVPFGETVSGNLEITLTDLETGIYFVKTRILNKQYVNRFEVIH